MKPTTLLFVALAIIFTLTPTSEAACANIAVYTNCKTTAETQLAACAFDDWTCKCTANTARQNCYLQCQDDPAIQTEGEAYRPVTEQACSLAASQSSAKAQATPVATSPQAPPSQAPATTPPPSPPSSTTNTAKNAETTPANSAASDMFAAVPLIAAVTIMNFIIGQFV